MSKYIWLLCGMIAAAACAGPVAAEESKPAPAAKSEGIKRIPLQRFEVPGTNYETIIGLAEIQPNVSIGRHTHPGPESGYVTEGSFELIIDGETPRRLQAGDSYVVTAKTVHDAKAGPEGAKVIATYVIEKGQPLASPTN